MTPNQIADDIIQRYTESIIHNNKLDLHKLIVTALKLEYRRGYKVAKEKWRNANTSNT